MDRRIEAFEAADRIINKLSDNGFDITITDEIINAAYNLPDTIHYEYGASRLVVWDDECDYVVKVARDIDFEKYNQREVQIYEDAVDKGLEENFGWCACYIDPYTDDGSYEPGIYVMEFLGGFEDEIYEKAWTHRYESYCKSECLDSNSEDVLNAYQSNYSFEDDNEVMLEYMESEVEPSKVGLLDRFIYSWDITDLHPGNFLLRDDKLVICDYAGWGW